ncbi:MAG: hypothetical protein ACRD3S_01495, partial [Terracidiphilus sp.]
LTLWQLLIWHRRTEIQGVTNEQALFVKSKLESELTELILPLERLAGRGSGRPAPDNVTIESDARLLMSGYPAYQAIEWVDPDLHVRWATPSKGNEKEPGSDL